MFSVATEEEYPVFVCKCCGEIILAVDYEEDDVYRCIFCNECMTKTCYSLYEDEFHLTMGITQESVEFLDTIFVEYVKDNPDFDSDKLRLRLNESIEVMRRFLP